MKTKSLAGDDEEKELLLPKPELIRSKKDILLILSTQLLYLSSACVYSSIAPLYTLEATKKGTTTTVSGLVFATYPFIIFVLSPIVGKVLPQLGPVSTILVGSFLEGFAEILFGFIIYTSKRWIFVLFSFLLRIAAGVGASFSRTALISTLSTLYPDHVSTIFGILEFASGIGLMIGPFLCSLFYSIGGFKIPFIVTGSFVWLMIGVVMLVLPKNNIHTITKAEKLVSITRVVKVPGVAIIGMCVVTSGICISFYESTIAVHLDHITQAKFSKIEIGAYFLFSRGCYTVSAPIWGYIVEHKTRGKYFIIIGHILLMIAFILMGPVPFLQDVLIITPTSTAISLCLLGVGLGPYFVPAIGTMRMYATDSGLETTLSLSGIISGLCSSCFCIGSIIGPIIGGIILQYSAFPWACFIMMVLLLAEASVLTIFILHKACQKP